MEDIKIKVIDFFGTIAMRIMIDLDDIIDTLVTVGITVVVCLVVTNFFFMPVRVVGTSMYPQLKDNQFGFSNIVAKRTGTIDRFDIVVIHIDESNENLVKRVIGLPGETLWYLNGILYINGTPVEETFFDEEYVNSQLEIHQLEFLTNDVDMITLADDEYYCLGDNRLVSSDSRFYGPFKYNKILAKDIFVIYPFDGFGKAD